MFSFELSFNFVKVQAIVITYTFTRLNGCKPAVWCVSI